ncbi:MAG: MBL fold metallo-hydrolase [Bryobacter sp.]|nr:MBL fold metallo-hydrolase [Bryobacter sp.]
MASSSAGNAVYVSDGATSVLVDCGISGREALKRLEEAGIAPESLDAIFITHEHTDHICGLAGLARKIKKPIFLTKQTALAIDDCSAEKYFQTFDAGTRLSYGSFSIQSFSLPHDAVDPVGYTFECQAGKVGICTDLGYITDSIRVHLSDCDLLLLESNHDLEMLKVGPYPWSLKQRVMSRRGHLSNEVVVQFIGESLTKRTRRLVLGHLSEHNNLPALVQMMAQQALNEKGFSTTELFVAEPGARGELIELH